MKKWREISVEIALVASVPTWVSVYLPASTAPNLTRFSHDAEIE